LGKEMMRAVDKSWQYWRMRGDNDSNKALPQMSNVSMTQQSTSYGKREDKRRYGDGGQQRWRMMMVADDDDT
jgi:hypothetical protein